MDVFNQMYVQYILLKVPFFHPSSYDTGSQLSLATYKSCCRLDTTAGTPVEVELSFPSTVHFLKNEPLPVHPQPGGAKH